MPLVFLMVHDVSQQLCIWRLDAVIVLQVCRSVIFQGNVESVLSNRLSISVASETVECFGHVVAVDVFWGLLAVFVFPIGNRFV